MRSNGEVRFLRISTAVQLRIVALLLLAVSIWMVATGITLFQRYEIERRRAALSSRAAMVAQSAGEVEAFRSSVEGVADRVEARQRRLDRLVARYFGHFESAAPVRSAKPIAATGSPPGSARLTQLEHKQIAFAGALSAAAAERSRKAEGALRALGVDPRLVTSRMTEGVGGPLVPITGGEAAIARLGAMLARLDRLERALLALPARLPAFPVLLSSPFGVRADPFTGGAALHTGLDIRGSYGQPIYAAAAGRVVRVGPWSGYGNVVVIDHGHGIETRYGHLSGFATRPGAIVAAGQEIARMGSTGRSTGNHLHFEVRINGRAVNPRPFLEARDDVRQIQDTAGRRLANDSGGRG